MPRNDSSSSNCVRQIATVSVAIPQKQLFRLLFRSAKGIRNRQCSAHQNEPASWNLPASRLADTARYPIPVTQFALLPLVEGRGECLSCRVVCSDTTRRLGELLATELEGFDDEVHALSLVIASLDAVLLNPLVIPFDEDGGDGYGVVAVERDFGEIAAAHVPVGEVETGRPLHLEDEAVRADVEARIAVAGAADVRLELIPVGVLGDVLEEEDGVIVGPVLEAYAVRDIGTYEDVANLEILLGGLGFNLHLGHRRFLSSNLLMN